MILHVIAKNDDLMSSFSQDFVGSSELGILSRPDVLEFFRKYSKMGFIVGFWIDQE